MSDILDFISDELKSRQDEWAMLAWDAGISKKTIHALVEAKREPNCSTAERVLEALGYEITIRKI